MDAREVIFDKSLPEPNSGCWIWLGEHNATGYGVCWAFGRREQAHRASFRAFHGGLSSDLVVRHRCDTPCCVNPDHLELGSHADNVRDRVERGRQPRGSGSVLSKLTEQDVAYIRASGIPKRALARKFDVSQHLIQRIIARKCWKHV